MRGVGYDGREGFRKVVREEGSGCSFRWIHDTPGSERGGRKKTIHSEAEEGMKAGREGKAVISLGDSQRTPTHSHRD